MAKHKNSNPQVSEEFDNYILWTDEIRNLIEKGKDVFIPGVGKDTAEFLATRCSNEKLQVFFAPHYLRAGHYTIRPDPENEMRFIAQPVESLAGYLLYTQKAVR